MQAFESSTGCQNASGHDHFAATGLNWNRISEGTSGWTIFAKPQSHRVDMAMNHPLAPPGDRQGNLALISFLGVVISSVILFLWELYMLTSAVMNQPERITGWNALMRELPALVLLIGLVVVGLILGVHSARLGSRRGRLAVWLLSLAVFLVLEETIGSTLEEMGSSGSIKLANSLIPAFAAAALLTLSICLWLARKASQTASVRPPGNAGAPSGYKLAVLVALAGIAGGFIWLFAAQTLLTLHADDFARTRVPGSLIAKANSPGTLYVYAEGGNVYSGYPSLGDLVLRVIDPSGRAVKVTAVSPMPEYRSHGKIGRVVGRLYANSPGSYVLVSESYQPQVDAPHAPSNIYGGVAVGDDVTKWMQPNEWGVVVLESVTIAVALVLSLATLINRRQALQG